MPLPLLAADRRCELSTAEFHTSVTPFGKAAVHQSHQITTPAVVTTYSTGARSRKGSSSFRSSPKTTSITPVLTLPPLPAYCSTSALPMRIPPPIPPCLFFWMSALSNIWLAEGCHKLGLLAASFISESSSQDHAEMASPSLNTLDSPTQSHYAG